MINTLLNVVAPVFIIASLGWGWSRLKIPYDSATITKLVMNIGAPSLIFSTVSSLTISADSLGEMAIAATSVIIVTGVVAFVILKIMRMSVQGLLPPLIFGNTGNMGLPICYFALGDKGLALAVIVFTFYALTTMTIGLWIYSGTKSPVHLLKSPILYASITALFCLTTGELPPELIMKTTRLLGQFTVPLMLITLGISLGNLTIHSLGRALATSALRLCLGFAVGVLITELVGLTGVARGVVILQSSMPVAVFNYLLAKQYERNSEEVAELVFVSTLLSMVSIPLILTYLS